MRTVRESELGSQTFLSAGGFAEVYRLEDYTLPGDPTPLAFKKFTRDESLQTRSATAAVDFRDGLPDADRASLDAYSVWPRALVTSGNSRSVTGLLMPLITEDFFCELNDEDTGEPTSKPREMTWLISTDGQRRAAGVDLGPIDRSERLILLAQLVYIIGRLHKHGWVFGDISFRNATFALDPPRVMLLDCDGAAPLADGSRKQAHSPQWEPPECRPPLRRQQDEKTDVYKLGLAVLRCLTPGKGATSSRKVGRFGPGDIDGTGLDLVGRALEDDRSRRPTAKELYVYLKQTVTARIKAPDVRSIRLSPAYAVRGQDVTVEWDVDDASEAVISHGNGARLVVDPGAHPRGYTFRPDASGPVSVELSNKFGGVRIDLGWLSLFEVPEFEVGMNLPRPEVPVLTAFQPPIDAATLHGRPRIAAGVETMEIPRVSAFDFVDSLVPVSPVALITPEFATLAVTATDEVRASFTTAGAEMDATLRPILLDRAERLNRNGASS